jgi:hypothetical protein
MTCPEKIRLQQLYDTAIRRWAPGSGVVAIRWSIDVPGRRGKKTRAG